MATELGNAYVQLMPSAKGISGLIQKQLDPEALSAGKSAGQQVNSGLAQTLTSVGGTFSKLGDTLTKAITLPAVGAVSALTGITMGLGFGRLVGLDSARAQLQGLGYDAKSVDRISGIVSDSIQGTVVTMAEGVSIAAGVDEGEDLARYIGLVGSAAVGAGADTNEMAQIFNRVQGSGKLMGTELNMIEQRMPGFAQAVSKHLKVPQEEMRELASQGKISSDDFLEVMDSFAGDMGEAYAGSWRGILDRTKSNIGILGEIMLGGVFERLKETVASFLEFIRTDDVRDWARRVGESIGNMFNTVLDTVQNIIQWWTSLDDETRDKFINMAKNIAIFAVSIGPVLKVLGGLFSGITGIIELFTTKNHWLTKLLPGGFKTLGAAVKGLAAPFAAITAVVGLVVGAFVDLWKNNEEFRNKITEIWNSITSEIRIFVQVMKDRINDLGINFKKITETIKAVWKGFTEFMAPIFVAAFETILNTLKTAFAVIVTIFDVFVAAFQGDWDSVWNGVKLIFYHIWEGIKAQFETAINMLKGIGSAFLGWFDTTWSKLWQGIKDFFYGIMQGIANFFIETWEGLKNWFSELLNSIGNFFRETWEGIKEFFTTTTDNISTGFSTFIENVITWFSELPGRIAAFFTQVWENVTQWASDMWNKAIEIGTNFVTSLVEFFNELPYKIGYAIGYAYGSIIQWGIDMWNKAIEIGTNFLNAIVEFFTQLPGRVKEFITNTWNNIVEFATNMWTKATEIGSKFLNNIVTFFTQLPGKVQGFISDVWGKVSTWASNMWTKATELGTRFLNNIVNFFTQLPGRVQTFISNTWNRVATWASNMWNKATEMGTRFLNNVVNFMSQLPGRVWNFLSQVISRAATWVTDMGRKGREAIVNLGDRAVSAAAGMLRKMVGIGKDVVRGVWEGITGMFSWITGKITGFFGGLIDGAKSALGISSPSKLFAGEIGKWIPAGIAAGIDDNASILQKSLDDASTGLKFNPDLGFGENTLSMDAMRSSVSTVNHQFDNNQSNENKMMNALNNFAQQIGRLSDQPVYVGIDGQVFARATRDPLDREFGKKSRDTERGLA